MNAALAVVAAYETLWLVALAAGAVVLVVVVALLHRLLRTVDHVDRGVRTVWESATRLAANTATTWQLGETAGVLEQIEREASLHAELLDQR